jgi:hypothetical protein
MKTNIRLTGISIIALFVCCAANGATVQGFESGLPSGSTIGDASIQGTYEGIVPPEGSNQLLLTTINNSPNSDPGVNPISANNAVAVGSVADFVGNSLGGVSSNTLRFDPSHTGREGSAFDVTLSLSVGDVITFQYDFLTSEDPTADPPNQDFGFATLVNSAGNLVNYQLLGHQTTATNFTGQSPFFNETGTSGNHYSTYSFSITTAGTYTLGIGVMDGLTQDGPSALLVDNISVVPEPGTVALGVIGAALLGVLRARSKKA